MIRLQKPEAIVFDWDNTLINSWPTIHQSLKETYEAFDKEPPSLEYVMANVKYSLRDSFPDIFGNDWEKAKDKFYESYENLHIDQLKKLEGVDAFLESLAALNIPLSIVSNKTGEYLRKEVTHLGWDRYFHKIIGAGDAKQDKPAIDPLIMALDGIMPVITESTWFIGDSEVDVKIAENAKCTSILLHFDQAPSDMVAVPHHVHPSFSSLFATISKYY